MGHPLNQKPQELITEAERLEGEANQRRAEERKMKEEWWAAHADAFNVEKPEVFVHLLVEAAGQQGRAAQGVLALEMSCKTQPQVHLLLNLNSSSQ